MPTLMVQNMLVSSRTIWHMDKEHIPILTVQNMKVNGRVVREMEKGL